MTIKKQRRGMTPSLLFLSYWRFCYNVLGDPPFFQCLSISSNFFPFVSGRKKYPQMIPIRAMAANIQNTPAVPYDSSPPKKFVNPLIDL